ncbi:MAG: DUF5916 domain-containing protein [Balneolaceae bacterium]
MTRLKYLLPFVIFFTLQFVPHQYVMGAVAVEQTALQDTGPVAQTPGEPLSIQRLTGPVVMDGRVNEEAWVAIPPLPVTTYEPVAGLTPSEETEFRVAYDDDYIYFSMRGWDSDPDGIRINSLYRDRLSGDDVFHILLDSWNDYESAIGFTITPSGAKRDGLVSGDGQGGMNADFMTYWDVETHVDDLGWQAEVRIPFSSLGYQDDNGRVVMGLYLQRGISRKNERITFPEVQDNIAMAYFRPSLAQRISFEGIYSRRPLHITPYVAGGVGRDYQLNSSQTAYEPLNSRDLEAGVDIKYGLGNNLNLDLTINTDFAQVEADDQQVNLTRFDLFFPEKRQFFQERSGIFSFETGTDTRLFHSRRIGLTDTGDQVRILGGGRVTGRIGDWDVGVLNMQTDRYGSIPAENFGVVRFRREVFNPGSWAGVMAASRLDMEGGWNFSYGADGLIRLGGEDFLSLSVAHSLDEEDMGNRFLSGSSMQMIWERRSRQGLNWLTRLSRTGDSYNPGTGFVPRRDYMQASQDLEYGWMPGVGSALQIFTIGINGEGFWRESNGQLESAEAGASLRAVTPLGDSFDASVSGHFEEVPFGFTLLNRTNIPAGEYRFMRVSAGYQMGAGRLFRTRIQGDSGTFYGGWRHTITVSPTWNLSRHLELEASWLYNMVDVPGSDGWFDVHLARVRVRTALDTRLSSNAFVQLNSAARVVTANVRIRYNIRDGNDIWFVYNEGFNTERDRLNPRLPLSDVRTVMIKYTHTFHR